MSASLYSSVKSLQFPHKPAALGGTKEPEPLLEFFVGFGQKPERSYGEVIAIAGDTDESSTAARTRVPVLWADSMIMIYLSRPGRFIACRVAGMIE